MGRVYYAYSIRKCAIGDDEMATKNGILLLVLKLETKKKEEKEFLDASPKVDVTSHF